VYASSSNTNLELIATLYDVAPDGTATKITDGVVLGSQRQLDPRLSWYDAAGDPERPFLSQTHDVYLAPGKPYRFDIPLLPQQWAITPGDSLRLTLTTQELTTLCATATFSTEPCYNTAPQKQTLPGGTYSIRTDRQHPSALSLPLLPYEQFRTANSRVTPTSGGIVEPLDWGPEVPSLRW
jgi:uncharacterized protein